jgi:Thioredoxin like C-terminal domain
MSVFQRLQMPSLTRATAWLNSKPRGPAELRGHAVLVNFWTLTCINWLRQEPYVRAWSRAYQDDGLIVIGVHTPEFSFEHDVEGVRRATTGRAIDYPVAVDNDYAVWSAFDNNTGRRSTSSIGKARSATIPSEGRYEKSERTIHRMLGLERGFVPVEGAGVEAQADWPQLATPETYLGYRRGERLATADGVAFDEPHPYELPQRLRVNHWALAGEWTIGHENVVLHRPGGSIAFRFHARDAHIVLSPGRREPVPFRVLLDGEVPGASHGLDIDEDGSGQLRDGRLYQLVRQHGPVRERTLTITFLDAGAEAYGFTYG